MTDIQTEVPATLHGFPEKPDWRAKVRNALRNRGGVASLRDIYQAVLEEFPVARGRKHWQAKIRQIVQKDHEIERVEKGVYGLRSVQRSDSSAPK